jgi:hypothetical protein
MSYKIDPETGYISCDSLSQALAASREIRAKRGAARRATRPHVNADAIRSTLIEAKPSLVAVLQGLQKRPKQYMELLQKHPGGLADSQAWLPLKLEKRGHISGVLTSLRNAFAKAGYSFEQVIERNKYSNGNGREHRSVIRSEVLDEVRKGVPIAN